MSEIYIQTGKTKKKCAICEEQVKDGDVVIELIKSVYGSKANFRLYHLKCLFKQAKGLLSKEEYNEVYDEWLISKV